MIAHIHSWLGIWNIYQKQCSKCMECVGVLKLYNNSKLQVINQHIDQHFKWWYVMKVFFIIFSILSGNNPW